MSPISLPGVTILKKYIHLANTDLFDKTTKTNICLSKGKSEASCYVIICNNKDEMKYSLGRCLIAPLFIQHDGDRRTARVINNCSSVNCRINKECINRRYGSDGALISTCMSQTETENELLGWWSVATGSDKSSQSKSASKCNTTENHSGRVIQNVFGLNA